jgi:4-hydroxyphenylpyruvate dioxygenase
VLELMMRGISSLSFSGPLRNKIEAAGRSGFDGIEIFREDLVYWDGAPPEVPASPRTAGSRS